MILYHFCCATVRGISRIVLPQLQTEGLENIPADGPFLLIANHQSVLDPLLIQSICPRVVYTMAKSTQFAHPIMRWLMPRICSFPVRRYQIDPQAVRYTLQRLHDGEGVGIYIEGERSWDGRLQPARLGTLRLILKAGVPVVPTTIAGSYDVWPRWHRAIRPAPVHIRFGEPLRFPRLDRREDRDKALPETERAVMGALRRQLAATTA